MTQPTPAPTTAQPTPTPSPLPGICSDGTGSCSATDMSQCDCAARRRTLLKGGESKHTRHKQDLNSHFNLRRLAKRTPSPIDQPTPPPTSPPVAPTNPVRSQFAFWLCFVFVQRYSHHILHFYLSLISTIAHWKSNQWTHATSKITKRDAKMFLYFHSLW